MPLQAPVPQALATQAAADAGPRAVVRQVLDAAEAAVEPAAHPRCPAARLAVVAECLAAATAGGQTVVPAAAAVTA